MRIYLHYRMLASVVFATASIGWSATYDVCDQSLLKVADTRDPQSYRQRGDRCEGTFINKVSSTGGVAVVSVETAQKAKSHPIVGETYPLTWRAPGRGDLHIRVFSLRYRFYYRMDSLQSLTAEIYRWPADLLVKNSLNTDELGLTATTKMLVNGKAEDVYVPMSPTNAEGGPGALVHVSVVPPSRAEKLYLTVARMDANGALEAPLVDGRQDPRSYFPENRATTVELPIMAQGGIYSVEIGMEFAGGVGTASTAFLIYSSASTGAGASSQGPGTSAEPAK